MPVRNPGGSSGTPGGSDTQVQFNDAGAFGGDAGLTYVKATDTLTVATAVVTPEVDAPASTDLILNAGSAKSLLVKINGAQIASWQNSGNVQLLRIDGAFSPTSALARGVSIQPAMTLAVNADGYGTFNAPTFVKAGSGTHAVVATFGIQTPTMTGSGATVTSGASCYIENQPSFATTNYALWVANGGVRMGAFGSGAATFDANGNISSVSDLRFKENVVPYEAGLAEIRELQPLRYNWTSASKLDTARIYVGFGAQDVRPWLPDAVDEHRKTGELSFNPHVVIAALVNAVKALAARLDALDGGKEPAAQPIADWAAAVGLDPAKFLPDISPVPVLSPIDDTAV